MKPDDYKTSSAAPQANAATGGLAAATRDALGNSDLLKKAADKWLKYTPETVEGSAFSILQTASMPGAKGAYRLLRGEERPGAVLADVVVDTAKGFASGYAIDKLGTQIGTAAAKAGLGGMTNWNAHMAIAASILQSSKLLVRYISSEIDREELLEEVNRAVITGTASFYYGSLGQTVIPIPVVGALVGSTVGYFTGNILYQSGLLCLGETIAARQSKERRKHVEDLCLQAVPLMQRHRAELQTLISVHFSEQTELFASAFDAIDIAFEQWDPDSYLIQLEKICGAFNTGLPVKSFREFDELMNDCSKTFDL